MTRVIAFMGKAESGKSTSAKAVRDTFGIPIFSFAEPIKDAVNPLAVALFGSQFPKEKARPLYQFVGGHMRGEDPNFWIDLAAQRMSAFSVTVMDDLRYENEAAFVRSTGGLIIQVIRPGHQNRLTPEQRFHSSETEQENITPDILFFNTNKEELEENVVMVVTAWLRRTGELNGSTNISSTEA